MGTRPLLAGTLCTCLLNGPGYQNLFCPKLRGEVDPAQPALRNLAPSPPGCALYRHGGLGARARGAKVQLARRTGAGETSSESRAIQSTRGANQNRLPLGRKFQSTIVKYDESNVDYTRCGCG